jgi:hypothetical protein
MSKLNKREEELLVVGFINGYNQGHNDTVESAYGDSEEIAKDWIIEEINPNGGKELDYLIDKYFPGDKQ